MATKSTPQQSRRQQLLRKLVNDGTIIRLSLLVGLVGVLVAGGAFWQDREANISSNIAQNTTIAMQKTTLIEQDTRAAQTQDISQTIIAILEGQLHLQSTQFAFENSRATMEAQLQQTLGALQPGQNTSLQQADIATATAIGIAAATQEANYRNLNATMEAQKAQFVATQTAFAQVPPQQETVIRNPAISNGNNGTYTILSQGGGLYKTSSRDAGMEVGRIWPGDQVNVLKQEENGQGKWAYIRVVGLAPNRGPGSVPGNTEGWIRLSLVFTPTPMTTSTPTPTP